MVVEHLDGTYILPIRRDTTGEEEDGLSIYLAWLSRWMEVLVVDGSPPHVFAQHRARWPGGIRHLPPDPDLRSVNGKAWGVNTGLRHASHDRVVIGDDDVRYDEASLRRVLALLEDVDVVRPQNYFEPRPWHAQWDTGRTLPNRAFGGDWPGTLGLRRNLVRYYDGDVLFENLELCRTVKAAGGLQAVPLDLYVRRLPPTARHFWSQRVRQAYDEFARPPLLVAQLALVPAIAFLLLTDRARALLPAALLVTALAEVGRRRSGGRRYFPAIASFLAPLWLLERGVCSWLAVWQRLRWGGVRYRGGVLPRAAHSTTSLRQAR